MDINNLSNLAQNVGAAYAALQLVAQGMLALQRIGTTTPEKTIWFKFWKFLVSGPARTPVV